MTDEHPHDLSIAGPTLRDLAALLALPRMWRDRDPAFITGSMLDVIMSLLRSDVAYVRLECETDEMMFEQGRPAGVVSVESMARALESASEKTDGDVSVVSNPVGTGHLRLLRIRSQLSDQQAIVVIGSQRPDFPTELENFLCRVAIEQAMIALHWSRLVANLKAANAAKSTFLATMSHELRTPLNAVIGYSELLQAEISGQLNERQKEHVHRVEVAARHLLGLIEGILHFARLEAGKEEVFLGEANAVHLAEGVAALVEPLARAKGLTVSVTVGEQPLPIRTDAAKVRQVLLNLLSNAVKFTSHGTVTLDVRADPGHVSWSVMDQGVGIPAGDVERIFEPFRQVGESYSARAPGTGLGLSVSRQLARLLGGDVTVRSVMGRGSTFVLRLPRQGEAASLKDALTEARTSRRPDDDRPAH